MTRSEPEPQRDSDQTNDRAGLLRSLGVTINDTLLELALTHRSYAYENGDLPTNERLEHLGDAVVGWAVADALYRRTPALPEGLMSRMRNAVVDMSGLAKVARAHNVGAHIRLGQGEERSGGRDKASILADTLEALIGAVYVDHGPAAAFDLVLRLTGAEIERVATLGPALDWKSSLQELATARELDSPWYEEVEEGVDHQKTFTARVLVGGVWYGPGEPAGSKKAAHKSVARLAWHVIQGLDPEAEPGEAH